MRWWVSFVAFGSLPLSFFSCAPAVNGPSVVGPAPSTSTSASASTSALAGGAVSGVTGGGKVPMVLFPLGFDPAEERVLGPGEKLYVGDGGERWIVREKEGSPMQHEAAKQLAPESLVAARQVPEGWVFLGVTGTVFTAKTPLGPLDSQRPAPRAFRAVSAGKDAFVGLTPSGELHRSVDRGKTWSEVALPSKHATSLLLSSVGQGLVLAPPLVFATLDDGATFARVASPIGAMRLRLGQNESVVVEGLGFLGPAKPGGPPRLSNYATGALEAGPKITAETKGGRTLYFPYDGPHLAHASAIADGKATLAAGVVYEPFVDSSGDVPWWRLSTYELGQSPSISTLGLPPACADAFASSAGALALVACVADADPEKPNSKPQLIVTRTEDRGKTWAVEPLVEFEGSLKRVRAIGKTAVLLETDYSAPAPHGLWIRTGKAKPVRVDLKLGKDEAAPNFAQIVASDDGSRVFATAARTTKNAEGDEVTKQHLWVSKDGGRTFTSRALPDPDDLVVADPVSLQVEGNIATLIVPYDQRMVRYATKDDGATFDRAFVDLEADQISMAGERGLATTAGKAFETVDGGRTWTKVTMPTRRRFGFDAIACAKAGCVLGDRGVRLGWEVAGPADVKPWKPEAPTAPSPKPKAGPPIACTTGAKPAKLGALEQLQWSDRRVFGVLRGEDGAFDVVIAEANAAGEAGTRVVPLFGKGKAKTKYSSAIHATVDGVLVARAIPSDTGGPTDVEVAFFTAPTGKVTTATLPKAVTFPKPVGKKPPTTRLELRAVVVAGLGAWVFVGDKLHSVGVNGKVSTPPLPEKLPIGENYLGVRGAGVSHLVAFHPIGAGLTAFVGVLDDGGKTFSSNAYGLAADAVGAYGVTTLAGAPYLTVSIKATEGTEGHAYALRIDAKGTGDPLPLIAASPLAACAGNDPGLSWDQRAVSGVTVDGKPRWGNFDLVMRGTDKACVAGLVQTGSEGLSASLATGGVVLKRVGKDLEARGLKCKLP